MPPPLPPPPPPQQQLQSDGQFRQIAAQHTTITGLLDSFFGFLKRHTDFYLVSGGDSGGDAGANVGFPPGKAELLTLAAFRKYALADVRSCPGTGDGGGASDGRGGEGGHGRRGRSVCDSARLETGASALEVMRANLKLSARKARSGNSGCDTGDGCGDSGFVGAAGDGDGDGARSQDLQAPVHNGGVTERYWWEQTLSTVCLHIPVPYVGSPAHPPRAPCPSRG